MKVLLLLILVPWIVGAANIGKISAWSLVAFHDDDTTANPASELSLDPLSAPSLAEMGVEVDSVVVLYGNTDPTKDDQLNKYEVIPSNDEDPFEPSGDDDIANLEDPFVDQEGRFSLEFFSFTDQSDEGSKASDYNCTLGKKDISTSSDCIDLIQELRNSFKYTENAFESQLVSGSFDLTDDGQFGMVIMLFGQMKDNLTVPKTKAAKMISSGINKKGKAEVEEVVKKWCNCVQILKLEMTSNAEEACFKIHAISDELKWLLNYVSMCGQQNEI